MAKVRPRIPKAVSDQVLKEFSHLCAICAKPSPQLHHIDENPENNAPLNLLPLCPNHHLTDQHNPTRRHHPEKLRLFRIHKDPAILKPQFEPLFRRLRFLLEGSGSWRDRADTYRKASVLAGFVRALEMGAFYGDEIAKLLGVQVRVSPSPPKVRANISRFIEGDEGPYAEERRAKYYNQLLANTDEILLCVIEQLRFQRW